MPPDDHLARLATEPEEASRVLREVARIDPELVSELAGWVAVLGVWRTAFLDAFVSGFDSSPTPAAALGLALDSVLTQAGCRPGGGGGHDATGRGCGG